MDKKNILTAIVTAILVLISTSLVRDYMNRADEGDDAAIGKIVDDVIEKRLKMADGKSYGMKLSEISDNQIKAIARLDSMEESISDVEEVLKVLSSD